MVSGVRPLLILLASIAVMTIAFPVFADPPGPGALPVHVVAVKSDDALDQAEALTVVLKKAIRDAKGWSLGDSEQSLEFLALKMNCTEPIDAACEARIAEVLKADRYLWAVIAFDPADKARVTGTLNFYVRGKGTSRHTVAYSANLTDSNADALIEVAREAVDAVTGGPPKGTLKVGTGGVAGQIFIDEQPMGAIPAAGASYPLVTGDHRVVVKAQGYEDAEGSVTVQPATSVELNLTLLPVAADEPVDGRFFGGLAALAVGVAAGAVGLWASLEVNSINSDSSWDAFLASVPDDGQANACERAQNGVAGVDYGAQFAADIGSFQSKCDNAGTFEVLQAVMYPVAGVAAGVGLYLIMTSDLVSGDGGADAVSRLRVVPIITHQTQALAIGYDF